MHTGKYEYGTPTNWVDEFSAMKAGPGNVVEELFYKLHPQQRNAMTPIHYISSVEFFNSPYTSHGKKIWFHVEAASQYNGHGGTHWLDLDITRNHYLIDETNHTLPHLPCIIFKGIRVEKRPLLVPEEEFMNTLEEWTMYFNSINSSNLINNG
jgi:hypothetical protein